MCALGEERYELVVEEDDKYVCFVMDIFN